MTAMRNEPSRHASVTRTGRDRTRRDQQGASAAALRNITRPHPERNQASRTCRRQRPNHNADPSVPTRTLGRPQPTHRSGAARDAKPTTRPHDGARPCPLPRPDLPSPWTAQPADEANWSANSACKRLRSVLPSPPLPTPDGSGPSASAGVAVGRPRRRTGRPFSTGRPGQSVVASARSDWSCGGARPRSMPR